MKNSYPESDDKILGFFEILFWNIGIFLTHMVNIETLEKCVKKKVGVLYSPALPRSSFL